MINNPYFINIDVKQAMEGEESLEIKKIGNVNEETSIAEYIKAMWQAKRIVHIAEKHNI